MVAVLALVERGNSVKRWSAPTCPRCVLPLSRVLGPALTALVFLAASTSFAQVTDLDIWVDSDFDGLPGPTNGILFSQGIRDSVAIYIDSRDLVWTNFLCRVGGGALV